MYTNNTAYGCRENRENSIPGAAKHVPLNGPIFGAATHEEVNGGAYNDHQYNMMEQNNQNHSGLQFGGGQGGAGGNQMRMGNHSLGRNTFYVSDYQL